MDSESSYQHERRKNERHVHYADSTSEDSDNDMDTYLDEAFDNSEDDERRESLVCTFTCIIMLNKILTILNNFRAIKRVPFHRTVLASNENH